MSRVAARLAPLVPIAICAAVAAAQQPGPPKVLAIEGRVLDIVGIARGIEGTLKDLGAKTVGQEIVIELAADVLFDFDKADLKPEARGSLAKVADVINGMPNAPATVDGHTDGKGAAAYNQQLSERRANSVRDWLVKEGNVPAARLTARGFGMTKPVAANAKPDGSDDPDGRQKNRRVEIRVRKT